MEQITTQREPGRLDATSHRHGPFSIVAIAASLGGVKALGTVIGGLSRGFPLPILICQHLNNDRLSVLPDILGRQTGLRVVAARQGETPLAGSVYVAPPGRHLLIEPDCTLGLSDEGRVNFCRPSADVLFRSLAAHCGARAIAVVLTGRGRDGARGAELVRERGGFAIAQDRGSSEAFDMPLAARDIGRADLVLPIGQIAAALAVLAEPAYAA